MVRARVVKRRSDSMGKSEYEGNEGIHSWCSGAQKKTMVVRCRASTGHCHSKTLSTTPRMVADEGSDFWFWGNWARERRRQGGQGAM